MKHNVCYAHKMNGIVWLKILNSVEIVIVPVVVVVVLRVPNRNFRDFISFSVDFKRRNCPSTRCASAANVIDSDIAIVKWTFGLG
jgi:hypothetical protein